MKTNEFTYKVMDLNTAQLEIPRESYQRELSPDRVKRIVKDFDERIANEPKVSYRSGHYYVFDGQHWNVGEGRSSSLRPADRRFRQAFRRCKDPGEDLWWRSGSDSV